MSTPNKPVHEIRLGRIRASVWANQSETGVSHSVTITRLYKPVEAEKWASTDGFYRDDLLVVAKVADLANTWIYEHGAREKADEEPAE